MLGMDLERLLEDFLVDKRSESLKFQNGDTIRGAASRLLAPR
jgi:hypothetical protein